MKTFLTAEAAKASDLYTVAAGNTSDQTLIHLAADAVLHTLKTEGYDLSNPLVLCGSGNNGADGFALACLLKEAGADVKVLYLGKLHEQPAPTAGKKAHKDAAASETYSVQIGAPILSEMSEQCRAHYKMALAQGIPVLTDLFAEQSPAKQASASQIPTEQMPEEQTPAKQADAPRTEPAPQAEQPAYSLYIDAVYGTGMRGTIKDKRVRAAFDFINQTDTPAVAVDIPSGVSCDTGAVDAHALCASHTVTMQKNKAGLVLYPGAEYAGKITVADIGLIDDPESKAPVYLSLEDEDVDALLPARPTRSNKSTFGRVLVVAGASGMAGAAYLAAMAAYRAGAGLVEIFTTVKNRTVLQQLIPEAVMTCYAEKPDLKQALKSAVRRADVIVLGCGIGRSKLAAYSVGYVLKKATVPVIVDADALNIIAEKPSLLKKAGKAQKLQTVITPHPVEAARLLGKKVKGEDVLANPVQAAEQLCDQYKVNVLLKDARTLILSHDKKTRYINLSGSTALAGAGSGDILAGMIGGLCAAKTGKQPITANVALAAYLHGKAGEAAEQKIGARAAMARDILDALTE